MTDRCIVAYLDNRQFTVKVLTHVSGTTFLNQILMEAWFDTQMGPRPIKALALGRINGLEKGA
jgi:hypothetical protein